MRNQNPDLFPVDCRGLRYWCFLNRRDGAKNVLVMLANTMSRTRSGAATFFPVERDTRCDANVLWILDPTLLLDDRLEVSSFLGTYGRDPIDGVVHIARSVAQHLNVDDDRVIYWGHSGAGFAALMCAIRARNGRAVAVNPQIETIGYRSFGTAKLIADVFIPGASVQTMCSNAPLRTSVVLALREARATEASPRLVVAQNIQDRFHYLRQFMALCLAFGLPELGGTDARGELRSIVYDSPEGHEPQPRHVSAEIASSAFPFLLDSVRNDIERAPGSYCAADALPVGTELPAGSSSAISPSCVA